MSKMDFDHIKMVGQLQWGDMVQYLLPLEGDGAHSLMQKLSGVEGDSTAIIPLLPGQGWREQL